MFCTKCGSDVGAESRFCGKCGGATNGKTEDEMSEGAVQLADVASTATGLNSEPCKIEEDLRSGRWNAFLINGPDYDAYVFQGEQPIEGLFSGFSKAKKEQDVRIDQRKAKLLQCRWLDIDEAHFKRMATKPEKELRHVIWINPKNLESSARGMLGRLEVLIDTEKIESGVTVGTFPIKMVKGSGVLFVTTKGICAMYTTEDGNMGMMLPYALTGALGPAGAIVVGLAAVAGHAIAGKITDYVFNKSQREVVALAKNFPPSLLTRCFGLEGSVFVPYNQINMFACCKGEKDAGSAVLVYANGMDVPIGVDNNVLDKIALLLSAPSLEELTTD